jgi:hypothetical protein
VLGGFMRQSCPVVASMVVAEKHAGSSEHGSVVECVSKMMGKSEMSSGVMNWIFQQLSKLKKDKN